MAVRLHALVRISQRVGVQDRKLAALWLALAMDEARLESSSASEDSTVEKWRSRDAVITVQVGPGGSKSIITVWYEGGPHDRERGDRRHGGGVGDE